MREWEWCLEDLGTCPNVVMKVGGLHREQCGLPLGPDQRPRPLGSADLAALLSPFYERVIRGLGANRCMFESNFPADKWGVGYGVMWNTFKRVAAKLGLSAEEKAAIFHGTA